MSIRLHNIPSNPSMDPSAKDTIVLLDVTAFVIVDRRELRRMRTDLFLKAILYSLILPLYAE